MSVSIQKKSKRKPKLGVW